MSKKKKNKNFDVVNQKLVVRKKEKLVKHSNRIIIVHDLVTVFVEMNVSIHTYTTYTYNIIYIIFCYRFAKPPTRHRTMLIYMYIMYVYIQSVYKITP